MNLSFLTRPRAKTRVDAIATGPEGTLHAPVIVRHARAKKMTLRVHPQPPHLRLIAPIYVSMRQIMAFYQAHTEWANTHLERLPGQKSLKAGTVFPLFGVPTRIEALGTSRDVIRLEPPCLWVPGDAAHIERRVQDYVQQQLWQYVRATVSIYADALGVTYQHIALREMTSRWGSCSSHGNLTFAKHLVFAPKATLDYVIAHEVTHLKILDHSPAFWRLLGSVFPDYAVHKAWLKAHGGELLQYPVG